ncbi:hypothetical protein [Capybara microvirus Cap3_SP_293]|nr:hypothetical protein [Capybara microvirus Cap3_SP_293]
MKKNDKVIISSEGVQIEMTREQLSEMAAACENWYYHCMRIDGPKQFRKWRMGMIELAKSVIEKLGDKLNEND